MSTEKIVQGVLAGDQRVIARAISLVENRSPNAPKLIEQLFGRTGRARVIGVTGPPGVGKSTLVDCLTTEWRSRDQTVGILAVDPTSPVSGGAILGDRIRMQSHSGDGRVYVRSMAARGHLGGLAHATSDAVVILDSAGTDVVIIETVGVGQAEVDVARIADVSIVVTVPGAGDDVQAIKAGIMEIADIFVVNKADREGADRAVGEIEASLMLQDYAEGTWRPPVLRTEAATCVGVSALVDAVLEFDNGYVRSGDRRLAQAEVRLHDTLMWHLVERLERREDTRAVLKEAIERIARREVDPYTAAGQIMEHLE